MSRPSFVEQQSIEQEDKLRILVQLDGVLRRGDQPIPEAVRLILSLTEGTEIVVLSDESEEATRHWLGETRLLPLVDTIMDNSVKVFEEDLTRRQITLQRSQRAIDMVITADPDLAAWCFDKGMLTFVFLHPGVHRPEWRPDAPKKVRAWSEIEGAVKRKALYDSGFVPVDQEANQGMGD